MSEKKIPNVGAVVQVTTRWPEEWLFSQSKWRDTVYEGEVVRSNPWDHPNTFKLKVNNPQHPNPIIALNRVLKIVYLSGSGTVFNTKSQIFKITGSKGSVYTVSTDGKSWQCTCPGFQFRKSCKHLDEVRMKQ